MDAECVEEDGPPTKQDMPPAGPDAEEFPCRVELVRAPRSGLVHAARLHVDRLCPVDRALRFDLAGFQNLLLNSSWDRLEHDLRSATAPGPAGTLPPHR
jgi:hypothetical protein